MPNTTMLRINNKKWAILSPFNVAYFSVILKLSYRIDSPNRLLANTASHQPEFSLEGFFQNRYLLSFLSALVEQGVFREVIIYFLIVGHTGNSVDQLFREVAL